MYKRQVMDVADVCECDAVAVLADDLSHIVVGVGVQAAGAEGQAVVSTETMFERAHANKTKNLKDNYLYADVLLIVFHMSYVMKTIKTCTTPFSQVPF